MRLIVPLSLLTTVAVAQVPGEYSLFGSGCNGNGTACISLNPNGGTLRTQTLPNEYSYPVQATSAVTVIGFNLYNQSASAGTVQIQAGLYLESATPGRPDLNAVATGTMSVSPNPGFHSVILDKPVMIAANSLFWISADTNAALPSSTTTGSAAPGSIYWRRPPFGGTAWSPTGIVSNPAYQIVCTSGGTGGAVPMLYNAGVPVINTTFDLRVANGAVGQAVFLFFGGSNTTWAGNALPMDLTALGAKDCSLLVSLDVDLVNVLGGAGDVSFTIGLPNDAGLIGSSFHNQAIVIDMGVNPLNLVFSNGGTGKIGG